MVSHYVKGGARLSKAMKAKKSHFNLLNAAKKKNADHLKVLKSEFNNRYDNRPIDELKSQQNLIEIKLKDEPDNLYLKIKLDVIVSKIKMAKANAPLEKKSKKGNSRYMREYMKTYRLTRQGKKRFNKAQFEKQMEKNKQYRLRHKALYPEEKIQERKRYKALHPEKKKEEKNRYKALHPEKKKEEKKRYKALYPEKKKEEKNRYKSLYPEKKKEEKNRYKALYPEKKKEELKRYNLRYPLTNRKNCFSYYTRQRIQKIRSSLRKLKNASIKRLNSFTAISDNRYYDKYRKLVLLANRRYLEKGAEDDWPDEIEATVRAILPETILNMDEFDNQQEVIKKMFIPGHAVFGERSHQRQSAAWASERVRMLMADKIASQPELCRLNCQLTYQQILTEMESLLLKALMYKKQSIAAVQNKWFGVYTKYGKQINMKIARISKLQTQQEIIQLILEGKHYHYKHWEAYDDLPQLTACPPTYCTLEELGIMTKKKTLSSKKDLLSGQTSNDETMVQEIADDIDGIPVLVHQDDKSALGIEKSNTGLYRKCTSSCHKFTPHWAWQVANSLVMHDPSKMTWSEMEEKLNVFTHCETCSRTGDTAYPCEAGDNCTDLMRIMRRVSVHASEARKLYQLVSTIRRAAKYIADIDYLLRIADANELAQLLEKPPRCVMHVINKNEKKWYDSEDYKRRETMHNEAATNKQYGKLLEAFNSRLTNKDEYDIYECHCCHRLLPFKIKANCKFARPVRKFSSFDYIRNGGNAKRNETINEIDKIVSHLSIEQALSIENVHLCVECWTDIQSNNNLIESNHESDGYRMTK